MSILSKLLADSGIMERRTNARISASGLEVIYRLANEDRRHNIKDIGDTGIYVITEDRWLPGTEVSLTLESKTPVGSQSGRSVQLKVRTVRQDEDGVAFTFVQNQTETSLWLRAIAVAKGLTAPDDPVGTLRAAKALAFLGRSAPFIEIEIAKLAADFLSPHVREHVIVVALGAEDQLRDQDEPARHDVPPGLILKLLQGASRAEDLYSRSFWAGLLASCFRAGADDDECLRFVTILSRLVSVHLDILTAACQKAMQAEALPEGEHSGACYCTADEIRRITRMGNMVAIEHHLHHLCDLGLLEPTIKPFLGERISRANMTPTSFGRRFYARCNGSLDQQHTSALPEWKVAPPLEREDNGFAAALRQRSDRSFVVHTNHSPHTKDATDSRLAS
jgi:hypothetical protein